MPETLNDGPYVFKNQNLHVKIQSLSGDLPADNYVPFVFSQFMLQKISFVKNRPMLPGQEVTNRPVLMGLDSVFFSSIFYPQTKAASDTLPTYTYLGVNWPDTGILGYDNAAFSTFLDLGIVLNALVILGLFLLVRKFFSIYTSLAIVFLILLFPFTINQTIFTWPKLLMAYFILSSIRLILDKKQTLLIALFLALAYHSHPSAVIYDGFILLYLFLKELRGTSFRKVPFRSLKIAFLFLTFISPWLIWANFIVKIPSDLFTQNLHIEGKTMLQILRSRIDNLFFLFLPWQYSVGGFSKKLFAEMVLSVPGSIGTFFVISYYYLLKYLRKYFLEIVLLVLGPMIVPALIFGEAVPFSIISLQPTILISFAITVGLFIKNRKNNLIAVVLILFQIILSLYSLWFGMYKIREQAVYSGIPYFSISALLFLQGVWALMGLYWLFIKDVRGSRFISSILLKYKFLSH